ncbi:MAG: ABA4-like family protein [Prochloraceae cyanobacterium]
MDINLIFNFANLFVLPFWGLMIFLPNWGITKKVMKSYIPFVILAGIYIYYFSGSLDPESVKVLSNPNLDDLAGVFAKPIITATGWTHFLIMDLFVGRWIYWQGQEKQILTIHSISLCLFAGPLGLLSHIVTIAIKEIFFSNPNLTEAKGE